MELRLKKYALIASKSVVNEKHAGDVKKKNQ